MLLRIKDRNGLGEGEACLCATMCGHACVSWSCRLPCVRMSENACVGVHVEGPARPCEDVCLCEMGLHCLCVTICLCERECMLECEVKGMVAFREQW